MYPSLLITFNIDRATKLFTVLDVEGVDPMGHEDLFGNAAAPEENAVHVGSKYFNLPDYGEMLDIFDKRVVKLKIVSGGQTGADRGAILAAMDCGIPWSGWCPKDRFAEDGAIPHIYKNLKETDTCDYSKRTELNVMESSSTIVFTDGPLTPGSRQTCEFAQKHNKPYLHIDISKYTKNEVVQQVSNWIQQHGDSSDNAECFVLNIAGSRESKAPGIQNKIKQVMVEVLQSL